MGIKDISGSVSEPNLQSADDNQNQLVDILVDLDQLHDHTFGIEHKDRKRQASESQASEAPSIRSAKHQSKVRWVETDADHEEKGRFQKSFSSLRSENDS